FDLDTDADAVRVAGGAARAGSAARNIGRDRDERRDGDPTAPMGPPVAPGDDERGRNGRRPSDRPGDGRRPRESRRLGLRRQRDDRP
ncbi:hypothetical protein, partial [Actinomycetospora chlora]|uniref:hypothetical protein n=1 Tax=Actinomycetospora chlora TaxID=663608 RepID=UPI0031EBD529